LFFKATARNNANSDSSKLLQTKQHHSHDKVVLQLPGLSGCQICRLAFPRRWLVGLLSRRAALSSSSCTRGVKTLFRTRAQTPRHTKETHTYRRRQHQGQLKIARALKWVRFCLNIVKAANAAAAVFEESACAVPRGATLLSIPNEALLR